MHMCEEEDICIENTSRSHEPIAAARPQPRKCLWCERKGGEGGEQTWIDGWFLYVV